MTQGKRWTHDELMLAMNLYCKLPFGQLRHGNPLIIEVAQKLGRTPSSLSMKLCNLASLEATGQKIYLQLKSGDSYLQKRKNDGAEIFKIPKQRHANYWMKQAFPVLVVIRNSQGEIRWMEVRDWLKCESENGKKLIKQIVFKGERFDVMSVNRWRDRLLGLP